MGANQGTASNLVSDIRVRGEIRVRVGAGVEVWVGVRVWVTKHRPAAGSPRC